jgi:MFS family permease
MISQSQHKKPSFKSIVGLTALVFFMSDVRDGVGPFLAIYLKSTLNWDTQKTGMALASMSIAAAIMQLPSGLLVDSTKFKRAILVLSAVLISVGCLIIVAFPSLLNVILAQSMIGVASAVIPPSIAAITIGLVGRQAFPKRVSINETWNHTGNLFTALAAGILGQYLGHHWILYVVGIFALMSIFSILFINPKEIDHSTARELAPNNDKGNPNGKPEAILKLLQQRSILIFSGSIIFFHLANAAQLPLVGQLLAKQNPNIDALFMAGSIISAQFVMIGVAYAVGIFMNSFGRKPIFLIAFLILPIRAFLYTLTTNPILLLCIQLLDGIGAGIFGVIAIVIVSDLTKGTGRFNFFQGLVALCTGVGAALSNLIAGSIVKSWGYNIGFLSLSLLSVVGLTFFWLLMPETKDVNSLEKG